MKALDNRHLGMDMVRTIAVLTVLVGHALIFFPQFFKVQWLIFLAVFGVELFFSLSGFLIGNILIRMSQDTIDFKQVASFWLKRWLRTVPVYLVIVIIIMLVKQKFYWSYLVFLQNYFAADLNDFKVSWSLTIEEWFYLTFPMVMYLLNKMRHLIKLKANHIVVLAMIIYVVIPQLLRYLAIDQSSHWDEMIRKQIHLRMDAIAYGVLLAYFYHINKQWFIKKHHSVILGLCLVVGFIGMWWGFNQFINIFNARSIMLNNVIFYPLINIFCTVIVAYFIRFQHYSSAKLQQVILFISLISYSLYLVHFPVYDWFRQFVDSKSSAFFYLFVAIVCIFICGTFLYRTVEKPFIDLRNKRMTSKNYSAI